MGAPTIHKIPTKGMPSKKIDPRHLELWQKRRRKQNDQKVVRAPDKR